MVGRRSGNFFYAKKKISIIYCFKILLFFSLSRSLASSIISLFFKVFADNQCHFFLCKVRDVPCILQRQKIAWLFICFTFFEMHVFRFAKLLEFMFAMQTKKVCTNIFKFVYRRDNRFDVSKMSNTQAY